MTSDETNTGTAGNTHATLILTNPPDREILVGKTLIPGHKFEINEFGPWELTMAFVNELLVKFIREMKKNSLDFSKGDLEIKLQWTPHDK